MIAFAYDFVCIYQLLCQKEAIHEHHQTRAVVCISPPRDNYTTSGQRSSTIVLSVQRSSAHVFHNIIATARTRTIWSNIARDLVAAKHRSDEFREYFVCTLFVVAFAKRKDIFQPQLLYENSASDWYVSSSLDGAGSDKAIILGACGTSAMQQPNVKRNVCSVKCTGAIKADITYSTCTSYSILHIPCASTPGRAV